MLLKKCYADLLKKNCGSKSVPVFFFVCSFLKSICFLFDFRHNHFFSFFYNLFSNEQILVFFFLGVCSFLKHLGVITKLHFIFFVLTKKNFTHLKNKKREGFFHKKKLIDFVFFFQVMTFQFFFFFFHNLLKKKDRL